MSSLRTASLVLIAGAVLCASPAPAVVGSSGNGNAATVCAITPPQTCVVITVAGAQKVDGSAVTQPVSIATTVPVSLATSVPVTQGTSPWIVNTPIPCPTSATASGVCKVSVDDAPSTGTATTVVMSATSVTILASNASRRSSTICNTGNHDLYLSTQATATATNLFADVPQQAGSTISCYKDTMPGYTGLITGIWSASGSGNAVITSFQ
jgi:hypothetical protein